MNKKGTIILICICVTVFSYIGVTTLLYYGFSIIMWPWSIVYDHNKAVHLDDSKYLNDTFPTRIIVYGDEIVEPGFLPIGQIANLEDEIEEDFEKKFNVIVINDRHNKLSLSDNEMNCIKDYVDQGWCLFYIGGKYLTEINDMFFDSEFDYADGKECSIGVIKYNGSKAYGFQGFWKTNYDDDDNIVRNLLIATIKNEAKRYYNIMNKLILK